MRGHIGSREGQFFFFEKKKIVKKKMILIAKYFLVPFYDVDIGKKGNIITKEVQKMVFFFLVHGGNNI